MLDMNNKEFFGFFFFESIPNRVMAASKVNVIVDRKVKSVGTNWSDSTSLQVSKSLNTCEFWMVLILFISLFLSLKDAN